MFRSSLLTFSLGTLLAVLTSTAAAQVVVGGGYGHDGWWGGWGVGNFSSTPAEGYARGMAEAIRAQGEYNQASAAAMKDYEAARSQYIENQKLWHETMIERRRLGEQARAERHAAERAARDRRQSSPGLPAPRTLTSAEYDRASGKLDWPSVLTDKRFSAGRQQIEQLAKVRAETGDVGGVDAEIYQAAKTMQTQLKGQVRNLPPNDYLEARKFLEGLMNDTRP
jgi:hypothetical protein